jgi:choline dehydrogenase-like flavoprotein
MIYIRGQAEKYDPWRDLGCPGWSYAKCQAGCLEALPIMNFNDTAVY